MKTVSSALALDMSKKARTDPVPPAFHDDAGKYMLEVEAYVPWLSPWPLFVLVVFEMLASALTLAAQEC